MTDSQVMLGVDYLEKEFTKIIRVLTLEKSYPHLVVDIALLNVVKKRMLFDVLIKELTPVE